MKLNKIKTAPLFVLNVAQVVAFDYGWLDTCESHISYPLEIHPSLDTEDLSSIFQFPLSCPANAQSLNQGSWVNFKAFLIKMKVLWREMKDI